MPQIGSAQLTAYLKSLDLDAKQWDLNVEFFNYFLDKKRLKTSIQKIKNKLFSGNASRDEKMVCKQVLKNSKIFINSIDQAIKNIKIKKIFNADHQYYLIIYVILECLKIISTEFYPTHIDLYHLGNKKLSFENFNATLKFIGDPTCNPFIEFFQAHAIGRLKQNPPRIIAFSVNYLSQFATALTFAKLIKMQFPQIHIVFGGSYISDISSNILKSRRFFDYVNSYIRKDGERPLKELIHALKNRLELDDVSSLIYAKKNKIIENTIKPPLPINNLPDPDFNDIDFNLYLNPVRVLPVCPSKGCYWKKCSFCGYKNTFNERNYEEKDIDSFIRTIKKMSAAYKTKHFFFCCDAISPSFLNRFSKKVIKSKLKIFWTSWMRPETSLLDKNVINNIQKAGCRVLNFGVESANPRIIKIMRKGINIYSLKEILRNCHMVGIKTILMLFFGFPGEKTKDIKITLDFIKSNQKNIDKILYGFFILNNKCDVFHCPQDYNIKIYGAPHLWHDLRNHAPFINLNSNVRCEESMQLIRSNLPAKYFDDHNKHKIMRGNIHYFLLNAS